ncbi:fdhD/NarQ family protein, partial [Vibrio parahaemolyticus V-223/04]|jgi:hypothetical protein|eukprot:symbB.v1.2.013529.t1/scaffold961.1/size148688/1
MC